MSVMLTSVSIIRAIVGGVVCIGLLYAADRAIVFHASLFRSQFSGDRADALFTKRPTVITRPVKLIALIITALTFSGVVATDGAWWPVIALCIVAFLTFMGLSLFETVRALNELREKR